MNTHNSFQELIHRLNQPKLRDTNDLDEYCKCFLSILHDLHKCNQSMKANESVITSQALTSTGRIDLNDFETQIKEYTMLNYLICRKLIMFNSYCIIEPIKNIIYNHLEVCISFIDDKLNFIAKNLNNLKNDQIIDKLTRIFVFCITTKNMLICGQIFAENLRFAFDNYLVRSIENILDFYLNSYFLKSKLTWIVNRNDLFTNAFSFSLNKEEDISEDMMTEKAICKMIFYNELTMSAFIRIRNLYIHNRTEFNLTYKRTFTFFQSYLEHILMNEKIMFANFHFVIIINEFVTKTARHWLRSYSEVDETNSITDALNDYLQAICLLFQKNYHLAKEKKDFIMNNNIIKKTKQDILVELERLIDLNLNKITSDQAVMDTNQILNNCSALKFEASDSEATNDTIDANSTQTESEYVNNPTRQTRKKKAKLKYFNKPNRNDEMSKNLTESTQSNKQVSKDNKKINVKNNPLVSSTLTAQNSSDIATNKPITAKQQPPFDNLNQTARKPPQINKAVNRSSSNHSSKAHISAQRVSISTPLQSRPPSPTVHYEIKSISDKQEEDKLNRNYTYYYDNYCKYCAIKFYGLNDYMVHRSNPIHLNLLKLCRITEIKVRIPPDIKSLAKFDKDSLECLKICPLFNQGKCPYENENEEKERYENYCKYPHYDIELNEWNLLRNLLVDVPFHANLSTYIGNCDIENILLAYSTKRMKKILGSYSDDTPANQTNNNNQLELQECTYDALWHCFIRNEMITCIQIVERLIWICKLEYDDRNRLYTIKMQLNKSNVNYSLSYLNNQRLFNFINLINIFFEQNSKNTCVKLIILTKYLSETDTLFEIDLTATSALNDSDGLRQALPYLCAANLVIDRSMFNAMHYAIDHANKYFLFPKIDIYNIQIEEALEINYEKVIFPKKFTSKQIKLVKRILSFKTGNLTPPLIVYGAFGTGKTECLAIAAELLTHKKENKVLICTYSESAADNFFKVWNLETKMKAIRIFRDDNYYMKHRGDVDFYHTLNFSPSNFKMCEDTKKLLSESRIIVCTFYASILLNEHEKLAGWLTHILIDETTYAFESEVIMPLTLASSKTTVVLVGDHKQLVPSINNPDNILFMKLNFNLLERLYIIFKQAVYKSIEKQKRKATVTEIRIATNNYFLLLNEVNRTCKNIVDFVSLNFYNSSLISNRGMANFGDLNSQNYYPLQFVEVKSMQEEYNFKYCSYENSNECEAILRFLKVLVLNWPCNTWGSISIGVISNQKAQIALIRRHVYDEGSLAKLLTNGSLVIDSIQNVQGLQFRIVLISTVFTKHVKNLEENYINNLVLSPFSINTCLTRAEELVIVFGKNEFLIKVPEYFIPFSMQIFWKNLITYCYLKKSFIIYNSANLNSLYFNKMRAKILNSKSNKDKSLSCTDSDLNKLAAQRTNDELLNVLMNESSLIDEESRLNGFMNSDDDDDDYDFPLSRKDTNKLLFKKSYYNPRIIRAFDFDSLADKKKRFLLNANDAFDLNEDEENGLDFDLVNTLLAKENNGYDDFNSDLFEYSNRSKSYYHYITKQQALDNIRSYPDKYIKCKVEYLNYNELKAVSLSDKLVSFNITSRYYCGNTLTGDIVAIEILNEPERSVDANNNETRSPIQGRVVCVLERAVKIKFKKIVCKPDEYEPYRLMKPLNPLYPKVSIMPRCKTKLVIYDLDEKQSHASYSDTHVIKGLDTNLYLVVLIDWNPRYKFPAGLVTKVLEPINSTENALKIFSLMYDLKEEKADDEKNESPTSRVSEEEAKDLKIFMKRIFKQVQNKERFDLTYVKAMFTIDAEDSKDIDDALSFEIITSNEAEFYKIGVHISDVDELVAKDSDLDKRAYKQGFTFYLDKDIFAPMLPKNYSTKYLSLKPNEPRPVLSLFFLIDCQGNLLVEQDNKDLFKQAKLSTNFEDKFRLSKSLIKSNFRLNYKQVDRIINKLEKHDLEKSLSIMYDLSQMLRKKRYDMGYLFISDSSSTNVNKYQSNQLIEEFMVLANSTVGRFLYVNYPYVPVLNHNIPDEIDLKKWALDCLSLENISFGVAKYFNCIKTNIQSLPSLGNLQTTNYYHHTEMSTLIYNFERIKNLAHKYLTEKNTIQKSIFLKELMFHVRNESNYPLLATSISKLKSYTTKSYYSTVSIYHNKNQNDLLHFDLNICSYIHFTSPIRRYVDLIVHRMVKMHLNSNERADENFYKNSKYYIEEICDNMNTKKSEVKNFDKSIESVQISECLTQVPVRCFAYVQSVNENHLKLSFPFIKENSKITELNYSLLGLSKQPHIVPITNSTINPIRDELLSESAKVNFQWTKNVFSLSDNKAENQLNTNLRLFTSINLQELYVRKIDINVWKKIHKEIGEVKDTDILEICSLATSSKQIYQKDINFNLNLSQAQSFSTEYFPNDVVKVQLKSELDSCVLMPTVQLISVTDSIDLCIEHKANPLKCFSALATQRTKDKSDKAYDHFNQYLNIWLPLLTMETLTNSVKESSDCILLTNCKVKWSHQPAYHPIKNENQKFLFGKFILKEDIKNLDFFDATENRLAQELYPELNKCGHPSYALAYACVQYKNIKPIEKYRAKLLNKLDKAYLMDNFTWVGHCVITMVKPKSDNETNKNYVEVVLAYPNMDVKLPDEVNDSAVCSIEIIKKPFPDSVMEVTLRKLLSDPKSVTPLCKSVVLGKISSCVKENITDEALLNYINNTREKCDTTRFDPPNRKQFEAIKNALNNEFTLIQGPPGTGKTKTCVTLADCFVQENKRAGSSKKKYVLYVSGSNKAVDVFGKFYVTQFDSQSVGNKNPNIIRVYSQQIQNNEYPNPSFFNTLKSPKRKNFMKKLDANKDMDIELDTNNSDALLKGISLHHVIREKDKPHAQQLLEFDLKLSLQREYEDRIRNRFCCCGSNLNDFKIYNVFKCDHARYFDHISGELSMKNRILDKIKSNNQFNTYHKCFLVIKLIFLFVKADRSESEQKQFKSISEISYLPKHLTDIFRKKFERMKNYSTSQFDGLKLFLDSLDFIEDTHSSFIYHFLNPTLKKYKNDDYNNYNEIMSLRRSDLYDKLMEFLDEALEMNWNDVIKYEEMLLKVEKDIFKNELKIDEYFDASKYLDQYNEIVEKACETEIKNYDVILSTCIASSMRIISMQNIEQLIADEAGMIKEPENLVPIICCKPKKIVLIGDHKQLRPIIKCNEAYDFNFDQSLFERYSDKVIMLEEQYRMHPSICKFASNSFYNSKLITASVGPFTAKYIKWPKKFQDQREFEKIKVLNSKGYDQQDFESFRLLFLNVKGNESKLAISSKQGGENSVKNDAEKNVVVRLFNKLINECHVRKEQIKILSPYKSQVASIATELNLTDKNISTVVTSQGGEWDIVILSTVRTLPDIEIDQKATLGWKKKHLGFLCDKHQINVAFTRAKRGLFIVGDKNLLKTDLVWKELLRYIGKEATLKPEEFI